MLRVSQVALAVCLLLSPVGLARPVDAVLAAAVLAGGLLLAGSLAGAAAPRWSRLEAPLCLCLGLLLIATALVVEPRAGPHGALAQWVAVTAGVLLVGLWAGRSS